MTASVDTRLSARAIRCQRRWRRWRDAWYGRGGRCQSSQSQRRSQSQSQSQSQTSPCATGDAGGQRLSSLQTRDTLLTRRQKSGGLGGIRNTETRRPASLVQTPDGSDQNSQRGCMEEPPARARATLAGHSDPACSSCSSCSLAWPFGWAACLPERGGIPLRGSCSLVHGTLGAMSPCYVALGRAHSRPCTNQPGPLDPAPFSFLQAHPISSSRQPPLREPLLNDPGLNARLVCFTQPPTLVYPPAVSRFRRRLLHLPHLPHLLHLSPQLAHSWIHTSPAPFLLRFSSAVRQHLLRACAVSHAHLSTGLGLLYHPTASLRLPLTTPTPSTRP
jgi:hypothetical protein